jgi:ABC-type polysaccharide/polyol phosphate transport system ATPase subunit
MSDIAIEIKNLTKIYKLYESPQDRLKEALSPFRRKYHRDFYALKDINLEVKKGETVGVIGSNGAGKSTLLKVITSIITPTSGQVQVDGRISALLELGAGFNPLISGLENVYFNGTLIGFSKEEMDAKLDDILAFADIGDFIHQPVRTYSSGMFVRLAFAVAVHIEPEILIVDEALAVGDMRFQLKCFRKMEEFKEKGNTFLLVTHNVGMLSNLCSRAIWLHEGSIFQSGPAKDVARDYQAFMCHGLLPGEPATSASSSSPATIPFMNSDIAQVLDVEWTQIPPSVSVSGEGGIEVKRIALYTKNPYQKAEILEGGEDVVVMFEVESSIDVNFPLFSIIVYDDKGKAIFGTNSYVLDKTVKKIKSGQLITVSFGFIFPKLHNGGYAISTGIADGTQESHIRLQVIFDALLIRVLSSDVKQKQSVLLKLDNVNFSTSEA